MPEAVIVDVVRTPVGRAFKGSLAALRPDETLAFVVDQLLERNPDVDPSTVEELIAGCGVPQGLQANNIARIAVLLSDKLGQSTNGSTISRYCASGLDAIRTAANAVAVGQGDIYIAGGVEFVSRYKRPVEAAHPEDQNEALQGGNGRPNAYIAMGLTAENVAERYGVSREDQDELRPALAGTRGRGPAGRVLRPRDRAGHAARRHGRRQGRRPARVVDLREARHAGAGLQAGRHGHRRQLLPAQRRRGRRAGHERREGGRARAQAARPRSSRPPRTATSPSTWASRRSGPSRRRWTAPA